MACKKFFTLSNGKSMPAIGYGTWQAKDDELEKAVEAALVAGYRHIDTAHAYENEGIIGKVIKRWIDAGKLKREDIFLVTKLPPVGMRPAGVSKFLKRSLDLLQMDYVDLYLVHTPFGFNDVEGDLHPHKPNGEIDMDLTTDLEGVWKAMEAEYEKGLAKAIGISNFNPSQIQRIMNIAKVKPASLQVELHAYHQQKELVELCAKNNIIVTAYSPLGSPGLGKFIAQLGGEKIEMPDILGNPVVKEIADKHKKSAAQVLLRHANQKGICAIPKSTNPNRLKQNIDIFDFELTADEMNKLNALDQGTRGRILDFEIAFKGIKRHPEFPF